MEDREERMKEWRERWMKEEMRGKITWWQRNIMIPPGVRLNPSNCHKTLPFQLAEVIRGRDSERAERREQWPETAAASPSQQGGPSSSFLHFPFSLSLSFSVCLSQSLPASEHSYYQPAAQGRPSRIIPSVHFTITARIWVEESPWGSTAKGEGFHAGVWLTEKRHTRGTAEWHEHFPLHSAEYHLSAVCALWKSQSHVHCLCITLTYQLSYSCLNSSTVTGGEIVEEYPLAWTKLV